MQDDEDITLLSCSHNDVGEHDCDHSQDIQLRCDATSPASPTVEPTFAGGDDEGSGGKSFYCYSYLNTLSDELQ